MYLYISRNKLRNDKCTPTFRETNFETPNVGLQFSETTFETTNVGLRKLSIYLFLQKKLIQQLHLKSKMMTHEIQQSYKRYLQHNKHR
jgi:hypothetical protein